MFWRNTGNYPGSNMNGYRYNGNNNGLNNSLNYGLNGAYGMARQSPPQMQRSGFMGSFRQGASGSPANAPFQNNVAGAQPRTIAPGGFAPAHAPQAGQAMGGTQQMPQMPQMPHMNQAIQAPQMSHMNQAIQAPQIGDMPQPPQLPQLPRGNPQAIPGIQGVTQPQQISHALPSPIPYNTPPQSGADGEARQGGHESAVNGLKNVGTFMGYPEYTLPGADSINLGAENDKTIVGGPHEFSVTPPSSLFESIKELCQNEKNSADYYESLAEKTSYEKERTLLRSIAKRAVTRSRRLTELHKSVAGSDYAPENREICKNIGYIDGLKLAVKEESNSLRSCAELAEGIESAVLREKLNNLIIEKLCQINELNTLIYG